MKNDILGFEGLYQVDNKGNVFSLHYPGKSGPTLMKVHDNGSGYHFVALTKNGKSKKYLVHRLVYEAFEGVIPANMTVDHIDGNKLNNSIDNLQLLSQSENTVKGRQKQVCLIEANYPYRELCFSSEKKASEFFGFSVSTLGLKMRRHLKKNENKINLRGEEYYFSLPNKSSSK